MARMTKKNRAVTRWTHHDASKTKEQAMGWARVLMEDGYHAKVVYEPDSDEADEGRPWTVYYKDR